MIETMVATWSPEHPRVMSDDGFMVPTLRTMAQLTGFDSDHRREEGSTMPQPEGAELQSLRERRASLRDTYLRPAGQRPPPPTGVSTTSR